MSQRLIGVDVGGTKVSIAVLSGGTLGEPQLEPTETSTADVLIDQLVAGIERAAGDEPVDAVGVGIPSVVDWATGCARASVNIPLHDVPLRDRLSERLGVPVFVDNDANCAGLAEAHALDGSLETRNLVMLTVGTGVGGGIVIDGRVYRGITGAAPEIGHMVIGVDTGDDDADGFTHTDRFPQPGSLEALASGTALDALARRRGLADGREAVARAKDGDPTAVEIVSTLGHRLGLGIANAINLFDPEVVAIGGGVSAAGDLLLAPAERTARQFVLPGVGTCTTVRIARSGPKAGVRGAALLAGQELALGEIHSNSNTTIQETR